MVGRLRCLKRSWKPSQRSCRGTAGEILTIVMANFCQQWEAWDHENGTITRTHSVRACSHWRLLSWFRALSWFCSRNHVFTKQIHLTCNITNLYCSVRWHDRELCNSLFERVFICIYAIPHLYTYLWCQFHHFHIQNEVSHATNLPRKFSFQKVRGDLDCKEEHSQVAKLDPIGFC